MALKSRDRYSVKPAAELVVASAQGALDPSWQNITDPIFHWAAKRPEAPAFIQLPETLTYGELAPLVGKAAVYLDSIGIRSGDRVAINLTNSIDHFILTLGLLRLGATTMEMAYGEQRPVTPDQLAKFGIGTIFIEPVTAPIPGFRSIKIDAGWRSLIEQCEGDRRSADNGEGIFTIARTSGTTGEPKGTLTTHRQYIQTTLADLELFADSGVFSSERPANFLLTASVSFSGYFRRFVSHLCIGGPITILPEYLNTIDLVKAIGAWDNAACAVSSAMCRVLISSAPQQGVLFPRLCALVAFGSFLYPEEKLAMLDQVSPNFYDSYGTSGFGKVAVLSPKAMRERPASVGRPLSSVEVQVVDDSGQPLPPGIFGRLRCRGTAGMGFSADVDATNGALPDGWHYPGDYAHVDEAGYIFLKGRSSDVIQRNGIEIFAAEVEAAIAEHPSVAEVAVVGVAQQKSGPAPVEAMVALVVPRGQAQHEALVQHCHNRLSAERWPDTVFYAQVLPKTPAGKLDRNRVKAIVTDEIARRAGAQSSARA
jgi:acyl-coenzyme A synthetase/AMP-(fatty) acid ligase